METNSLARLYTDTFHNNWEIHAFSDYEGKDYLYKDIAKIIKSLHLFYQVLGLQQGDKIAVLGRNSAHWGAVFLSALSARLVIVPVLPDFNEENTNHIINHSESKLLIGAKGLADKVNFDQSPLLQAIITIEDFSLTIAKDKDAEYKPVSYTHLRAHET